MIEADQQLFEWFNGFVGTWTWFDNIMKVLVSDFFLPVLIAAAAWSLWFVGRTGSERRRNQLGFIYGAIGAGFSNLAITLVNGHLDRARPFITLEDVTVLFYRPTDPSFPSNAAAFAFAMAAGVWVTNRRMGMAIGVGAVLFSVARVYAGMHFPLDVAGGALVGILVTYVFYRVLGMLQPVLNFGFWLLRQAFLA